MGAFIARYAAEPWVLRWLDELVEQQPRTKTEQSEQPTSKKARLHGLRAPALKMARLYAAFVESATGEAGLAEPRKRRRTAADGAEEEEDGGEREDAEEDALHRAAGAWRSAASAHARPAGSPIIVEAECIEEEEEGQPGSGNAQHERAHESGTASSSSASLPRTRGGRLRYDPSLSFLSDLSQPHMWYPLARGLGRRIHLHVGPTNSGKTHAALQALQAARTGVFCAPLRLLAWEGYDRLCRAGLKCNLVTGQELVEADGATHTASTVEMVPVEREVECAVVDEVQLIGSEDRGGAWTRAVLGVPAKDVHVCGDRSVVALMEDLCSATGEPLTVHHYQRLTPLKLCPALSDLRQLRKGDCVIAFSRSAIYSIKAMIESHTRLRVCVLYGSLPPDLRRQQAQQFNDGDGYDVLVATDVVGMGLNLAIGRCIFASMEKFDGHTQRCLTVRETLQIAGRAGRFGGEYAACGYVTTLDAKDYPVLKRLLNTPLTPLTHAGLTPSLRQLQLLAQHRPTESLPALLEYLVRFAEVDDLHFVCASADMLAIARVLQAFPQLSFEKRFSVCVAPVDVEKPMRRDALVSFISAAVQGEQVTWRSLRSWQRLADLRRDPTEVDILLMEEAWQGLDLSGAPLTCGALQRLTSTSALTLCSALWL